MQEGHMCTPSLKKNKTVYLRWKHCCLRFCTEPPFYPKKAKAKPTMKLLRFVFTETNWKKKPQ